MRHPNRGGLIPGCFARSVVLTLAVWGTSPGTGSAQQVVTIDVFNFDFGNATPPGTHIDPTIQVGDTIRWVWVDGIHSTTAATGQAEFWDSGLQSPDFSFNHTFTKTGKFYYYCSLHGSDLGDGTANGMSGFVVVNPVPEPRLVLLTATTIGLLVLCSHRLTRLRGRRCSLLGAVGGSGSDGGLRRAFSALEVLVVLSILGLLVGLLLPAVQRTREAANYTACRHNLRQLALAFHSFESAHGHYPGLGVEPYQHSALARLLPFLEQGNLHDRIDPNRPLFIPRGDYGGLDPAQAAAARTVVPHFLCPSDARPPLCSAYDLATIAGTNYVANAGSGTRTYYDFRYPTDGVVWYGSKLRREQVADGISSTIFFAEALRGTGSDAYAAAGIDPRRHWVSAGCLASPAANRPGTNPPLTDEMSMMVMVGTTWRGDRNVSWIGGPGHRTVFNSYLMPNDRMMDYGSWGLGRFKASSSHPGGVNMVLGDGSVHFIKDHIDVGTWRSLSTRGESEEIGSYCGCH